MSKNKEIVLLIVLIILFFAVNYSWLDGYAVKIFENFNREDFTVKRVIDGDTIVVGNDTHLRLFGINTPEKGEKYYNEARDFVNKTIFNKTIFVESFGKDKYQRELGMIFFGSKNFNAEIVEKGFANVYILNNRRYESEFRDAWNKCIAKNVNLCEKSEDKCANCIKLKEINVETQKATFENSCNFNCELAGWEIKDEGRKKFVFPNFVLENGKDVSVAAGNKTNIESIFYWEDEEYVWTETGDTLFLRDGEGKLVLWEEIK